MSNPIPLSGVPRGAGQFFLYPRTADSKGMPCSVVIPCHNGAELTRACIASLLQQRPQPDEIVIVDNASSDDTATLHNVDPRVRVVRLPQNLGFAGGVNAGLAAMAPHTDEVLVINNDTIAASNMLAEMRRALNSPSRVQIGACGPVSNRVKEEARLPVGDLSRDAQERESVAAAIGADLIAQDVDSLSGLCLLMHRTTLDRVGHFDERFGHGNFEDDDLSLRMRMLGMRLVIARRAYLHHEGHATFHALGFDMLEQIELRLEDFRDKWQNDPAGCAAIASVYKDLPGAARAAKMALTAKPDWLDAERHLGMYEERHGDPHRAIAHLKTFLQTCPEHCDALLALGLATVRTGDVEGGLELLCDTTNRHRICPRTQRNTMVRLGQIDYDAGEIERARGHFDAAIAIDPDCPDASNGLGLIHLARKDIDAAERCFRAAIERGHELAHTNLGLCLMMRGKPEEALRSFERAVELLPDDPVARANYEAGCAAAARTDGSADWRIAAPSDACDRANSTNSATIAASRVSGSQPFAANNRSNDGTRRGGSPKPAGNTSRKGTLRIDETLPAAARTI